ncbi:MAG: energy-coupled thiamine transporter ThiT [Coriobacteriia bacterium]|nr:energy-coupled thiamine transporter ThiT [Coriobacteriia bacterium]
MTDTKTRILVEIALTVALATVLNLIKLWRMPYGGDVSLEMLPILVLALRRGWRPGVSAGALYGVVALMLGPIVVHWAQFLLDYPLAYAALGVAGIFTELVRGARTDGRSRVGWTAAAVAAGAVLRFAAHFTSGLVFFGQYAPEGQPTWLYSLLYNGSYMLPAAILCAVAAAAILPPLDKAVPPR